MTAFDRAVPVPASDEEVRLRRRLDRERRARHEAERISERSTRELYERQRELALLVAVTGAANEAIDLEEALSRAIGHICAHTGWPVGHVYLADPDAGMAPTAIWHLADPDRFAAFRAITEATPLTAGEGLPGRILATGIPVWIPDVTAEPSFPRMRAGINLGVRGAFGFPILIGTEVVGVMEFFSDSTKAPDERLLGLMAQTGTELGRAIERDRASEEQRRLHAELSARAGELERSNAELEQFASIAAHDLQEPLRKIRTFSQRVVETETDRLSEQGRDYLGRANAAASRMQALVEGLLTFSRVATRGRPFAQVDLARLAADVVDDLEAVVERAGATVRIGTLPAIDADELQMRQLLQNLVSNALKFRREDVGPEISIDAAVRDEIVALSVRDNGIGFDPRYRERIFRVFERLHGRSDYDGTGIGLALCRKIAERHGGSVYADGEPGVGSTFVVSLPVAQLATDDGPAAA